MAAQKTPDVRLNTDPAPGFLPLIRCNVAIAAIDTNVYVAWGERRIALPLAGTALEYNRFNRSLDGGQTWLPVDIAVGGTRTNLTPQIAAAGSAVYLAWVDRRHGQDTDVYFNRSLDAGTTWLANDVRINSDPAGTSLKQSVQSVAQGSAVYIAWADRRSGQLGMYFNRSLDEGVTWLPSEVRLDTLGVPSWVRIAVSGSAVYAVWGGAGQIYFNRSLDNGATWLASERRVNATPLPLGFTIPEVAASGQDVYVTWCDTRNGYHDVFVNLSNDRGTTWLTNDVRLDTDPAGASRSEWPQIAASGSAAYVVWPDQRKGTNLRLNLSIDRGQSWLRRDRKLPSAANYNPASIAARGDSVYATWHSGSPANEVRFNRSTDKGTTWLPADVVLNNPFGGAPSACLPQIAVSGAGVFGVWADYRGGSAYDIYFNIPFGFQPYGAATPGSAGIAPSLATTGLPTLGATPTLDVTGGLGGAPGAILIGAPGSKVTVPLFGGTLLVSPLAALPLGLAGTPGTPGAGTTSLPLALPRAPSMVGVNLNFQALVLDAGAPQGVSMTNAIEMWIG